MDTPDRGLTTPLQQLRVLLREQRFGAFTRLLNQAMEKQGQSTGLCQIAAEYCRTTNNQRGMVQWLTRWAALAPTDPQPLMQLAAVFEQHGATDKVVEALTLAQQAGADAETIAICKAKALIAAGRYAAADVASCGLSSDTPKAKLLGGLVLMARNLAAAGRADLRELVRSVSTRSGALQADETGLLLQQGATVKRLGRPNQKPGLLEELSAKIKIQSYGCVIGSADLLDLAGPAARVHDGSFWGSRSRVYVVECDEDLLALALATFDVRDVLQDEAVTWIWGPTALGQLERYLTEREDESPQNITVSSNPQVAPVVEKASQVFHCKAEALFRESSAYYASLPREHWGDVFGTSPSRPPRILLITTEFSSFMKFSIRDLASAFERIGWQVQVAKESQPTQRMTGLTVPKAVVTFRPDLIWQINFMRSAWQGGVPDGVPFVCWDQDAMSHLASSGMASRMSKFDFLATLGSGIRYIQQHGYSPERLLFLPMCVDRSIFQPASDGVRETDVCYVSHHGWSLSQRIEMVLENLGASGSEPLRKIVKQYADYLDHYFAQTHYPLMKEQSDTLLAQVCRSHCVAIQEPGFAKIADYVFRTVANPIWRQQAVRWIAECNVSLRLYGQGWDQNPEFAEFAGGVVEHGEPLARVFRASRVALQAVLASNEHQRLWEAAACGCVVLMRYHPADEYYSLIRSWMGVLENGAGRPADEVITESMRSSPTGRLAYDFIRIVLVDENGLVDETMLRCLRHTATFQSLRDKLGDIYDDLAFRNASDARNKLQRILQDGSHRQRLRERLLQAVEEHSYPVQIARLIREIRERLLA